ncbi:hypothetical protein ACEPAF_9541 [Sanghuangporus sanghuang]
MSPYRAPCAEVFVLLLALSAFANPLTANSSVQNYRFNYGTTISEEEVEAAELDFRRKMAERVGTRELAARAATVPVYFHAVSEDDTVAGGNIPESQILDQIFVLNSDFSETGTNDNGGQVLTHETGHWVGLYHTFQGGCTGSGDMVDDTPAEAGPASGCPERRDTCPSPGVDLPYDNYMDYAHNSCMEEFTPGQIMRLTDQLATYRGL